MKFTLMLVLLVCSFFAKAEERRLALVRRIQGLESLPDNLSRQLTTLTLQVVTRQKDYELLLSGTDTPAGSVVDMVAVESEVGRTGDQYHFEARLLDIKSKKLISKAGRNHIREEDLARLFQGALESLFLPDTEKETESKEKNPKDTPKTTKTDREKKKVTPTLQSNSPPPSSLDFRQRVRELKSATDKAIADKVQETKDTPKAEAGPNKTSTKQETALSETGKPSISAKLPDPKQASMKNYPSKNVITAGYESRQIDSNYFIDTTTRVQLLTAKASGHVPLSFFSGRLAGSYDLTYSRGISAPVELPALYQAGLYASWIGTRWNSSLGLQRDSSFFVNLPAPGEGVTPSQLSSTWTKIRSEILLDIRGPWIIAGSYGMPLGVQTDYGPLSKVKKWEGNTMSFTVTPPLSYEKWETSLFVERMNLTAQGDRLFTFNESRVALFIRRSL